MTKTHIDNQTTHPDSIGIPQLPASRLDYFFPKPPTQPISPESFLSSAARPTNAPLLCVLGGHRHFAQNKPNSQDRRITTTSGNPKTYTNTPPCYLQKNKPKQTQYATR